ncbi:MAG: DUF11 domain-containing protein [Muribaculaceae bacterium]|nr:DUF11 domain-containing protein [Muribaculaceae bacterium]
MKLHHYFLPAVLAALAAVAAGCIDDKYDLSDIDTTSKFSVKDLVLPANIDPVKLGTIITYDDDSKIKPIEVDGEQVYALSEDGDFSSDRIYVESFTCPSPELGYSQSVLEMASGQSAQRRAAGVTVCYEIGEMGHDLSYETTGVDPSIESIEFINTEPMVFKASMQVIDVRVPIESVYVTDLVMQMPKGLVVDPTANEGSYDPATGLWTISRKEVDAGTTRPEVKLTATGIDFVTAGCDVTPERTFTYDGAFKVLSGKLYITPDLSGGISGSLTPKIEFRIDYSLSDIKARTFTGRVKYSFDGMAVDPVDINDIPDFLSEPGTNIYLANPQIYLQLDNPVGNYGLSYNAGFKLTAMRDNATDVTFTPDADGITVGAAYGNAGPYNFVLSPSDRGLAVPEGYAPHLEHIAFSSLGGLLAAPAGTEGSLPKRIGIDVVNPGIPSQHVDDFVLNTYIDGVKGKYRLVAPLALTGDTEIVYSDKTDGWFDEDSEDELCVEALEVTAVADNGAPATVTLTAYPLDRQGRDIDGAVITSTVLEPSKAGQKVVIKLEMKEAVKGLDGVRFEARIGKGNGTALSPSQTIVLNEIKARVSGYYITNF